MMKTGQFALGAASVVAEHSVVKLTTMVGAIVFIVGGTWNVSQWKSEVENELGSLKKSVEARTDDRWRARDMYYWCIQTEALNEGFQCGAVSRDED